MKITQKEAVVEVIEQESFTIELTREDFDIIYACLSVSPPADIARKMKNMKQGEVGDRVFRIYKQMQYYTPEQEDKGYEKDV